MIKATLNKSQYLRVKSALERVKKQAKHEAKYGVWKAADEYRRDLLNALLTTKYGPYREYSKNYAKWKAKKYGHLKFWQLTKALMNSIHVHQLPSKASTNVFFVGIVSTALNAKGRNIAQYGRVMEEGIGAPKRPLFTPSIKEFVDSGKFERIMAQSLENVKKEWR